MVAGGSFEVVILLTFAYVGTCKDFYTVNTKSGPVKGLVSVENKGTLYKFLKIPYAKPPVGKLRFKKPVPVKPWNDAVDATLHPSSCMQSFANSKFSKYLPKFERSEDCLYLNIYVPNELTSDTKKSVMVYIHGGAFNVGQASLYDGSHLALAGDVIVVIVNYRLNVFGFLTTWDTIVPGNNGLWDQILALKWVKNNIESFGGNPDSVTIFGQSAGSFSANFLSLMPRNKGLFQRVILQSGTANSAIATNNQYKHFMSYFVEAAGCNEVSSSAIVDCLREVSAENLTTLADMAFWDGLNTALVIPFCPRVDGYLITDKSMNLLNDINSESSKFFRSLDLMIGFTDVEGASFLASSLAQSDKAVNIAEGLSTKLVCDAVIPVIINSYYGENPELKEAICKKYSVINAESKILQAKKLIDMYTDWLFRAPVVQMINAHVKENEIGKTYHYMFTRNYDKFAGSPLPHWMNGAPHASDLPYLLLLKHFEELTNRTLAGKEHLLSDSMLQYWTNFAKYGNPNSATLPIWTPYTLEGNEFIDLGEDIRQRKNPSMDRVKFWLEDIPSILKPRKHYIHQEL